MGETVEKPIDQRVREGAQEMKNAILEDAKSQVAKLIDDKIISPLLSEGEINTQVETYLQQKGRGILDFLGTDGKVFVAMASAEKFADSVIRKLGIETGRVSKIKVSTYKNGESSGTDIDDATKTNIRESMNLQRGQKVLILEDMIDSGNTLQRLSDFFESLGVEIQILCLFDKNDERSTSVKEKLGENLQRIIDIGNEFIIGYGIDYSHRLFADLEGLYKVSPSAIKDFIDTMKVHIQAIDAILRAKQVALEVTK